MLHCPQKERGQYQGHDVSYSENFGLKCRRVENSFGKKMGNKEYIAASALADRIMRLFLDLISRGNAGKVERPSL